MYETRTILGYCEWIIIVGVTIGLFNYFTKKYKKLLPLIAVVIIPTWFLSALIKGIIEGYYDSSLNLFSLFGIVGLLAESLPQFLVFGGITFAYKYLKFRKER